MRTTLALLLLSATATAQDFIHYKFDSTCTSEIINYATGPQALAANGVLETTLAGSPWIGGMFGSALSGSPNGTNYNRVRTGWNPSTQNITGDCTIAWFMRLNTTLPTGARYIMGAPSGGFRLFTGGAAGTGLIQREILVSGGNSSARDMFLQSSVVDVQALAAAGWVHVAIVVDSTAQTASWFINGAQVQQLTNVPGANIVLAGPFTLGYYTNASSYDLDEFVLSLRAYSAPEIMALSMASPAGAGDYDSDIASQCGSIVLDSTGGRPSLGNSSFGLTMTGPANPTLYVAVLGFSRCTYGGVLPLPFDLGSALPSAAGCWLLSDNFTNIAVTGPSGSASLPVPVPNNQMLSGLSVFSQAVGIDLTTSQVTMSNGFVMGLGF